MGFYEISTGLGMIVGPLLGGWLYSIGGFGLPFYVVGGMMLLGAIMNFFLVPKVTYQFPSSVLVLTNFDSDRNK